MTISTRQAPLPRWVWPLTLVVAAVVLATFGRYFIAGMFAVIALAFVLALVSAVVWALLAMAVPGHRGALHELPRSPGEARAKAREARRAVVHRLGQAPWRSPRRVVRLVASQLTGEVFEMPSGPTAYSHLRVRMNPETLEQLNSLMPIQEVAAIWAEHYIDTHSGICKMDASVTVSISESRDLPRGRALIDGAFRPHSDSSGHWARAECSLVNRNGQLVAERGQVVRLGADHSEGQPPAPDRHEVRDETTQLDPDETVLFPAPGASPGAAGARAAGRPADDAQKANANATQLDPDSTMLLPAADAPPVPEADANAVREQPTEPDPDATMRFSAVGVRPAGTHGGAQPGAAEATLLHVQTRIVLGLQRVDPVTNHPLGSPPEFFDSPRVCIGRDASMDLRVDDPYVSREHAEVRRANDQWAICDSSTHGTALNGSRVIPGQRHPIRDGDIITLGQVRQAGSPSYRVLLTTAPPGADRR